MNWFERMKSGLKTKIKRDLPDGLWLKCESCGSILYQKELERSLWVCHNCTYHFRINHRQYIQLLIDEGMFEEMYLSLSSMDPLKFRDSKRYSDRVREARRNTGMGEAICTGTGRMGGRPVAIGVMDFAFMGGSMGSAVGEKVARLIHTAMARGLPLIIVSTSGGARMQEGILSLMQMAKTSARLAEFSRAGLLYLSVMTHPTTGGTSASFAMLGDVNIAEPKALIGFAGPRIIKETIGQDELPEGFQQAESVLQHGFLDMIVDRRALKKTLVQVLDLLLSPNKSVEG